MRRFLIALALALLSPPVSAQNLGEIATTNDDYSVCTEPSADKLLCDFALVPPYRQYEIDRPPATCAACDEFTGDDDQLTWRWGNQQSAAIRYETDVARLAVDIAAGTSISVRWTTGPDGSATDWVATAKYSNVCGLNQYNGLILLVAGDETTPTSMYSCSHEFHGGGALLGIRNITVQLFNNYTSFGSKPTQYVRIGRRWGPSYLRMRYVSSTKGFYCGYSSDGLSWLETNVQTLAAHPTTSMGFYNQRRSDGTASGYCDSVVYWFRVRSDAAGTTAPYPASD